MVEGLLQPFEQRVQRKGPRTQPWGAPVLMTTVDDDTVPTLTVIGLVLRKL